METHTDLLLLGKTGQGKSSTGNSILGRRAFQSSANAQSVTRAVKYEFAKIDDHIVKVVDGPGLDYSYTSQLKENELLAKQFFPVLSMCNGGVHAFVLVIRFGSRFTEEDMSILECLKAIFGEDYLHHVIVVLTGGDFFKEFMEEEGRELSFQEWCRLQCGLFRQLYDDCKGRFVLFDNRERDVMARVAQRKELLHLADALRTQRGRYTSANFQAAKETRDRIMFKLDEPVLREEIQQRIGLLTAEIAKLYEKPSENTSKQIKQSIQDLKDDIQSLDKCNYQGDHLRKLVDKMEESLNDVYSLQQLSVQLENVREAKKTWSLIGSSITIAGGALGLLVPFVGAVVSVTSAVSMVAGRMQIDSKEKEIENSHKVLEERLKSTKLCSEKKEQQEYHTHSKDD